MNPIEITLQALDAAERAIPPGQPVYMLNLLRYRAFARYEDVRRRALLGPRSLP